MTGSWNAWWAQLVLEGLALADVAAVEDDAAHVLVVDEIGVLHLEVQPGAVPMAESAIDHVGLRGGEPCEARATLDHLRQP